MTRQNFKLNGASGFRKVRKSEKKRGQALQLLSLEMSVYVGGRRKTNNPLYADALLKPAVWHIVLFLAAIENNEGRQRIVARRNSNL